MQNLLLTLFEPVFLSIPLRVSADILVVVFAFVLFFVVGVPLIYFYAIFKHKKEEKNKREKNKHITTINTGIEDDKKNQTEKKHVKEAERLINKSIEAFILGLEIYNKPTIKYRIEGFSFFIVNAWELMLKAKLVVDGVSIYYKDNPTRTLSVSDVVSKVYSDIHTRIRLNLERIIELRNISTHYITEDYEAKYAPLFQACVINFTNEIKRFHDINITDYISQNFLMLSASIEPLTSEQIKIKYPPEIAEKLIMQTNNVEALGREYNSDKFAISVVQKLYITKKRDTSDFAVRIDSQAKAGVAIVKELKDPGDTHPYSYNSVVALVKERLLRQKIKLSYKQGFNTHVLKLIMSFYNIKTIPEYSYKHIIGNSESYTYSQQLIEFIVSEIKKNPSTFVESLKKNR